MKDEQKRERKVPKLRFPGFTGEWEQRKLGEVAKYRNGKAHENDISARGKYIVVNSKFVSTAGKVRKFSEKQIEPLYKNEIAFVLSDVPNGRAIARTFLVEKDDKYTLNQRIAGITPLENIYPYFMHILMNRNEYFLKFDDGAKQTNLSVEEVMDFEEYYPDKIEQEQIGAFFQNLDQLITLQQHKLEHLTDLKKSLLQKMFSQVGEENPEIRFPGFTDDWEQCKIKDVANLLSGNGLSWEDVEENGLYECILYGNLYTDYGMIVEDVKYRTNKEMQTPVYSQKGDVLIPASDTTPTGLARAASLEKSGVLLGGDINIIRPIGQTNGSCLSLAINANKKKLVKLIKGTTVRHIHNSDIQNVEISLPVSANEQSLIVYFFKNLDRLITLHQRKLTHLQQLKKGLLQQMFV